MSQVEKAIALNESSDFYQSYLAPLKRKIELRTNLYSDANTYTEIERAFLLVEEIKEAKDPSLQKTILTRAVQHLSSLPPLSPHLTPSPSPSSSHSHPTLHPPSTSHAHPTSHTPARHDSASELPRTSELPKANSNNSIRSSASAPLTVEVYTPLSPLGSAADRAWLWNEVIRFAWEQKFVEIVLEATSQFLSLPWLTGANKEISVFAAQAHFMRAQALLAQSQPELDNAVHHFVLGMRIGVKLMETWLVFNAVILIWNAYFHVIKQSRHNEITETLQECFQALMQVNASYPITSPRDVELVASVANALACAHEQTYLKRKKPSEEKIDKDDKKKRAPSTVPDGNQDLKLAEDVCKSALSLTIPAPAHKRALLATLTRIQRYRGVTPQTGAAEKAILRGPEGESQIVSLLEVLATEPESRKRDLLAKAMDLLDQTNSSNTELMTMIAVEYYTLGEYSTSLQMAGNTLMQIPNEDKSTLESVAPKQWRWFAVNENLCGQSIVGLLSAMVKPEKATKSDKDRANTAPTPIRPQLAPLNKRTVRLYKQAAEHFAQGAKYGSMAQEKSLVLHAATNFWNAALSLISSSDTRWLLINPVQMVLHSLRSVHDATWNLQMRLYKLQLACLIDQKTWGEGLKLTDHVIKRIPKMYHESFWEERVVFKSNIKRSVEPYSLALKDNNKTLQAKSFILIAKTNSDKEKCITAFQKAISTLSDSPMDSIPYRMEYAHYLYSNCFPMKDVLGLLTESVDLLSSIEAASFEIEMPVEEEDPEQQYQQQAQRLSNKTKRVSMRSKDGKELKFKSQSILQQQQQLEKLKKEALKGILTIQHQTTLITLFIMLSTISVSPIPPPPSTSTPRVELLLMAQHWVVRVWEGFFAHAAQHPSPKLGKDETYSELPKSPVEWATVILTEEACARLRAAGNPFLLAIRTIDGLVPGISPEAFLSYLMYLAKSLETNGYCLHCFPVLAMARVLVGELSPKPLTWPLLAKVNLIFQRLCQKVHLEDQAKIWMDLADAATTQAYETKNYFVEELQYYEQLQTMKREANFLPLTANNNVSFAQKVDAPPIDRVQVRVVYRELAKLLIENGNLRYAKEFIAEASTHASVYGDPVTQAWCLHLSSKIFFIEGDYAKCIQLQHQALLSTVGEVEFWAESYCCLADAYLAQDPYSTAKPLKLLGNVLSCLNRQEESWPNFKVDILAAQSTVLLKYGALCTHQILGISKGKIEYEALEASMGVHEQSLQNYKQLGSVPQIVSTLLSLANLITNNLPVLTSAVMLQNDMEREEEEEEKEEEKEEEGGEREGEEVSSSLDLLTKAMELLQQAEEYANTLMEATMFGEYRGEISLPIADLLSSVKLAIGQLEWTMADLTAEQNQRRKETIEQLLDRYERQHQTIVAPEEQFSSYSHRSALVSLNSAYSLVPSSPSALFWLAIHIIAYSAKLGKPHTPWKGNVALSEESLQSILQPRSDSNAEIENGFTARSVSAPTVREFLKSPKTTPFVEQAITLMVSACEKALKQLFSLVPSASLALVDWLGQLFPSGTARYLTKAQSFTARQELLDIFNLISPTTEREKVLIRLESYFRETFQYPQLLQPYKNTMEYLTSQSLIWPRINCDANFQDIVDSLPKGVSVLVFHHTSDFRVVMMTCLTSDSTPTIARIEPDPEVFAQIEEKKRNFEIAVRTNALRISKSDLTPLPTTNSDPNLAIGSTENSVEQPHPSKAKKDKEKEAPTTPLEPVTIPEGPPDECVLAFAELLEISESFLAPLWSAFPKTARDNHTVLVLDSAFSILPFEALHVFVKSKSVTRELSLHFLANRLKLSSSRTPAPQKYSLSYIADPRNEDAPSQSTPPYKSMCNVITEDFLPARKKEKTVPEGVLGSDHTPTAEEWQKLMSETSHFVYFGFSPLFSYLEPRYVGSLNLSGCNTMILLDKATNEASHRRQTKMDISKSPEEKLLLTAHNTCALLSLRGVTSTITNQWHTNQKINAQLLLEIHELLAAKSASESLQHIRQVALTSLIPPNSSLPPPSNLSRGQSRQQVHEQHLAQLLLLQQNPSLLGPLSPSSRPPSRASSPVPPSRSTSPIPPPPPPAPPQTSPTPPSAPSPAQNENLPVAKDYLLKVARLYHKFNAVCYGTTFSAPKK